LFQKKSAIAFFNRFFSEKFWKNDDATYDEKQNGKKKKAPALFWGISRGERGRRGMVIL